MFRLIRVLVLAPMGLLLLGLAMLVSAGGALVGVLSAVDAWWRDMQHLFAGEG